jgi:hypothetical protein
MLFTQRKYGFKADIAFIPRLVSAVFFTPSG